MGQYIEVLGQYREVFGQYLEVLGQYREVLRQYKRERGGAKEGGRLEGGLVRLEAGGCKV